MDQLERNIARDKDDIQDLLHLEFIRNDKEIAERLEKCLESMKSVYNEIFDINWVIREKYHISIKL